jgi:RNA polymerase sigma factor (sigma-70 family)
MIYLSGVRAPVTRDEITFEQTMEQVDERLKDALERVPNTYREPFVLFALDGLSYAEVAERMSIPVGTVMSRIHRARQRMKARLGNGPHLAA